MLQNKQGTNHFSRVCLQNRYIQVQLPKCTFFGKCTFDKGGTEIKDQDMIFWKDIVN